MQTHHSMCYSNTQTRTEATEAWPQRPLHAAARHAAQPRLLRLRAGRIRELLPATFEPPELRLQVGARHGTAAARAGQSILAQRGDEAIVAL